MGSPGSLLRLSPRTLTRTHKLRPGVKPLRWWHLVGTVLVMLVAGAVWPLLWVVDKTTAAVTRLVPRIWDTAQDGAWLAIGSAIALFDRNAFVSED